MGQKGNKDVTVEDLNKEVLDRYQKAGGEVVNEQTEELKIGQRTLILNKLIRITYLETGEVLEPTPEIVWSLQDHIANELYHRISGGTTAYQEVVENFLTSLPDEQEPRVGHIQHVETVQD